MAAWILHSDCSMLLLELIAIGSTTAKGILHKCHQLYIKMSLHITEGIHKNP